jgi:hypothetical protein
MNSLTRVGGRFRREFRPLLSSMKQLYSFAAASLHSIAIAKHLEQRAWISRSAVMPATAVQGQSESTSLSASGKIRREVPLPSQEKKEGAMQYALYVRE